MLPLGTAVQTGATQEGFREVIHGPSFLRGARDYKYLYTILDLDKFFISKWNSAKTSLKIRIKDTSLQGNLMSYIFTSFL